MPEQLEDLLRACTVQVICGKPTGAGFFVAPGKVVTCNHVIKDSANVTVRWVRDNEGTVEFPVAGVSLRLADKGRPIRALNDEYPDIAVLDVEGLDGHPCVRIDTIWPKNGDTFQVYGYPEEGGTTRLTPAVVGYRGKHGNEPTVYLDLASDTIKPGMSGAAVLNLRTGGICGVVVASKNKARPDGALAVPWSAVESDLSEVLAANKKFHERNPAWNALAAIPRKVPPYAEELSRIYESPSLDLARFTGRRRLIAEIRQFMADYDHGWIVVEGEAGTGKSALAAHLTSSNDWFLHSPRFDGSGSPENARRNLAAQLTGAFELDEPDGAGLTRVLRAAAAKRSAGGAPDRPIVLVIDALNEIHEEQDDHPPLGLPVADDLPHKVFVVVTRLTGPEELSLGWPVETLNIETDEAGSRDAGKQDADERPGGSNADDMREYVRSLFDGPHSDPALIRKLRSHDMAPAVFAETLVTRCAPSWIYLKHVLDDVRTGRRPPADVVYLPGGLRKYYLKEISAQRGRSEPDRTDWRLIRLPALATLAALRRPATVNKLASLAGINDDAGRDKLWYWLDEMRALLRVDDDPESGEYTYEILDQSLRDLMAAPEPPGRKTGDRLAKELPQALKAAHTAITEYLMPPESPEQPGQRDWPNADEYVRNMLAEHAANAGRLGELVIDPGFLLICQPSSLLVRRHHLETPGILAVSAYEEALNEWAGLPADVDDDERVWRLHVWARKTGASELAVACGRRLALAGRTPLVQAAVWAGVTHRLMQHAGIGSVNTITTVPVRNGRHLLASGGSDGLVRFWDPATAAPDRGPLNGEGTGVMAAAVVPLPDQRILLATGDRDGTVRLWEPADRAPVGIPIAAHRGAVTAITVVSADDQTLLVTCGRDKTIQLWDPGTGMPVGKPLTGHDDWVMAAAAVPVDGMQLLATGSGDGTIRFWDLRTRLSAADPIACGNRGVNALAAVALSDDRAVLAAGGADGTVRLWGLPARLAAGEPPAGHTAEGPAAAHAGAVNAITVAWLAGRPLFASVGADRTIRMWEVTGKAAPFSFQAHAKLVKAIAAVSLPDGRTLLAAGGNDGNVELQELNESAAGAPANASSTGHSGPVTAIGVARLADRTVFVSGSRDRTVRLWNAQTGAPAGDPLASPGRPVRAVAPIPLPDGQNLIATSDVDGVVRLWDPMTAPPTSRLLKSYGKVYAIAPVELPGRVLLATGGSECTVRLWDPVSGEPVGVPLAGHTKPVNAITSVRLPDGHTVLVSGASDGTVRLWDPATGLATDDPLTGYGEKIWAVAAVRLADGHTLFAAGSEQGKVYVWNRAERVAVLAPPPRQAAAVTAIAAVELPDRTLLATGGDRAVRLWDPVAAKPLVGSLAGHSEPVNGIASVRLPDGPTMLATGGDDKTILIWTFG